MSVLARYVLWAWQTAGIDLDRELLFRPDVIEEFIDHACPTLTSSSRGTYRSRLLRVRRILFDADGTSVRSYTAPLPPADPRRPYSAAELSALRNWASAQHSEIRRRDCWTLLALGAGAGLASEDIVRLKTDDVTIDSLGILLQVTGRRARLVPVLAAWEQPIIDATSAIGPSLPLFGAQRTSFNNNAISALVGRSSGSRIKPSLQRLRITWILHHLGIGTPVSHLMRAAGIESLEAFDRYLRYLPDPDENEFRIALRGTHHTGDKS
jgi:integrase